MNIVSAVISSLLYRIRFNTKPRISNCPRPISHIKEQCLFQNILNNLTVCIFEFRRCTSIYICIIINKSLHQNVYIFLFRHSARWFKNRSIGFVMFGLYDFAYTLSRYCGLISLKKYLILYYQTNKNYNIILSYQYIIQLKVTMHNLNLTNHDYCNR